MMFFFLGHGIYSLEIIHIRHIHLFEEGRVLQLIVCHLFVAIRPGHIAASLALDVFFSVFTRTLDLLLQMLQHFINNCFEKLSYSKMAVASMLMAVGVSVLFLICYLLVMRREEYKE